MAKVDEMATPAEAQSDIDEIRQTALRWMAAVAAADLAELGVLMTDDIVVTHGNGRTLSGREVVLEDFAQSFRVVRVEQQIAPEETVVAEPWAFERARVRTTIFPRAGGDATDFSSRTLTILRKEPGRGWCVARSIGVLEQGATGRQNANALEPSPPPSVLRCRRDARLSAQR